MRQMFTTILENMRTGSYLRIVAYAIPLLLVAIVLYLNFLPFGYDKTFPITVGTAGDKNGPFYLEPLDGLSPRQDVASTSPYRILNGLAFAIFKPTAYLRHATASMDLSGTGITMLAPSIAFTPESQAWSYVMPSAANDCTYLDGASQITPKDPGTLGAQSGKPFMLYAEWTPQDDGDGFQQIAGRGAWELIQNKDDVKFLLGSSSVKYVIRNDSFLNTRHSALAMYQPATPENPDGHIDLYVDSIFSGRAYFRADANLNEAAVLPLTLGKSAALEASFFTGCVHDIRLEENALDFTSENITFPVTRDHSSYPILLISKKPIRISNLSLHVVQD